MKKAISLFLILLLFVSMISAVCARDVQTGVAVPETALPEAVGTLGPVVEEYFSFTCFLPGNAGYLYVPMNKTMQMTWDTNITDPISFRSSRPDIISVSSGGLLTPKILDPTVEVTIEAIVTRPNGSEETVASAFAYSVFTDVCDPNAYYFTPVYFAYFFGITSGLTDSHGNPTGYFKPNSKCTRGQIVTFLYRAYQSNGWEPVDTSGVAEFKDVKKGTYYYDAVKWAVAMGLTTGYTDKNGKPTGKFGPDDSCTRAQVVTFLWRNSGSVEVDPQTAPSFTDVKPTDYFYKAVLWAAREGLTTGYTDSNGNPTGKFGPNDICTRGQVVTFLFR